MKRSLKLNPDNRPATIKQIKTWRDFHETAPVGTTYGLMDCDEKADKRLAEQVEFFDHLSAFNEDGTLSWKMGDNSWRPFTHTELADAYQQVRVNRAKRTGMLHLKAAEFESMDPRPTVNELKKLDRWLEQ